MSTSRTNKHESPRRSEPGFFSATTPSPLPREHESNYAESSTSGSRPSRTSEVRDSIDEPMVDGQDSPIGSLAGSSPANSVEKSRHRSWRKGGFLLGSTATARKDKDTHTNGTSKHTSESKGKRKNDDPGLIVRKQRLNGNAQRSSYGGSPLAKEIKTDGAGEDRYSIGQDSDHTPSHNSASSHAGSSSFHASPQSLEHPPPSIGFDTDPAQIVNMALALSEGRRRYFSNPRAPPTAGGQALLSAGYNQKGLQGRRQGSLGQYLQSQRQGTRNVSPKMRNPNRQESGRSSGFQKAYDAVGERELLGDSEDMEDLFVSDATIARAEKAKAHLELLYEYRRLLRHLPPLKSQGRLNRVSEGRVYNPLQYVRNRKVRFREKQPIIGELDGWNDVERVRAWVDAVAEAHANEHNDSYTCVNLPQLSDQHIGPTLNGSHNDEGTDPNIAQRQEKSGNRPRRPRLDWVVHPQDLLADAYWLEQDHNKAKIEDRDGNKIYPDYTELKHIEWMKQQQALPDGLPDSGMKPQLPRSQPSQQSTLPDLPSFQPASRESPDSRRDRKSKILKHPILNDRSSGSGSRTRRFKKPMLSTLTRSLSSSSSGTSSSSDRVNFRGRRRKPRDQDDDIQIDVSNLDKEIFRMHEHALDDQPMTEQSFSDKSPTRKQKGSKQKKSGRRFLTSTAKKITSTRNSMELTSATDDENQTRTSHEDNTTAPSSPIANGFPSIAINLSPPPSRSPSPHRKSLPNPINFFRHDRNKSQDRSGIVATDFAPFDRSATHSRSPSVDPPRRSSTVPELGDSREQSPFSKRVYTLPEDSVPVMTHRRTQSSLSKKLGFEDQSSRIRGIFKGGRIAELVGSEVSKVGDFIWKRDAPGSSHLSSGPSSVTSDVELSEDESAVKSASRTALGRVQTSKENSLSQQDSRSDGQQPQYHISNLPSFTSPFKKDQDEKDGKGTADADQSDRSLDKSQSREDRLQRLAPPRLDTSRTSSTEDLPLAPYEDSRRSSYFGPPLSLTPSQNSAAGGPRTSRNKGVPITGLHDIPPSSSRSRERHKLENGDVFDSLEGSKALAPVSTREIARVRALLLTSALKAREINRRAKEVRRPPPKFLIKAYNDPATSSSISEAKIPAVTRQEEHVYAAKALLKTISHRSDLIRSSVGKYSQNNVPQLHMYLQTVEDLIDNRLTPRVRSAADSAGELSQSLTTTSTLAVKQLNDSIDAAARRRRRGAIGARLIRRAGFGVLEAIVVGILWAVWAVVSFFRLIRGTIQLVITLVKWLLWL